MPMCCHQSGSCARLLTARRHKTDFRSLNDDSQFHLCTNSAMWAGCHQLLPCLWDYPNRIQNSTRTNVMIIKSLNYYDTLKQKKHYWQLDVIETSWNPLLRIHHLAWLIRHPGKPVCWKGPEREVCTHLTNYSDRFCRLARNHSCQKQRAVIFGAKKCVAKKV